MLLADCSAGVRVEGRGDMWHSLSANAHARVHIPANPDTQHPFGVVRLRLLAPDLWWLLDVLPSPGRGRDTQRGCTTGMCRALLAVLAMVLTAAVCDHVSCFLCRDNLRPPTILVQDSVPKVAPEPKLPPKGAAGGIATAAAASAAAVAGGAGGFGAGAAAGPDGGAAAAAAQYEALIKARPEFAAMGKLFKSSAPVRCVGGWVCACVCACMCVLCVCVCLCMCVWAVGECGCRRI